MSCIVYVKSVNVPHSTLVQQYPQHPWKCPAAPVPVSMGTGVIRIFGSSDRMLTPSRWMGWGVVMSEWFSGDRRNPVIISIRIISYFKLQCVLLIVPNLVHLGFTEVCFSLIPSLCLRTPPRGLRIEILRLLICWFVILRDVLVAPEPELVNFPLRFTNGLHSSLCIEILNLLIYYFVILCGVRVAPEPELVDFPPPELVNFPPPELVDFPPRFADGSHSGLLLAILSRIILYLMFLRAVLVALELVLVNFPPAGFQEPEDHYCVTKGCMLQTLG
ncbi:hypothetical protein PENSPDRAFT_672567 [Peniophora sp. CONT]|nr:hypothetical protein PENSPDRAFT_672567 [Peniophora sp. CONT]